jgi:hypothetical protein
MYILDFLHVTISCSASTKRRDNLYHKNVQLIKKKKQFLRDVKQSSKDKQKI